MTAWQADFGPRDADPLPADYRDRYEVLTGRSLQFAAACKLPRTMAVAEETIVPDAEKPVRQHMDQ